MNYKNFLIVPTLLLSLIGTALPMDNQQMIIRRTEKSIVLTHHKYKQIIQELTQTNDSNEICVPIGNGGAIFLPHSKNNPLIPSAIPKPLTISTGFFKGCIATALHISYKNGQQYAGITHYSPRYIQEQKNHLKDMCLKAICKQDWEHKPINSVNFFIAIPKRNKKNDGSWFNDMWHDIVGEFYDNSANSLKNIVKTELGHHNPIHPMIRTNTFSYNYTGCNDLFGASKKEKLFEIIMFRDKGSIIINNGKGRVNVS